MENRRTFLKFLFPRLIGVGAAFSSAPSWFDPTSSAFAAVPSISPDDPKYASLIQELSKKHQFDPAGLKELFQSVVLQPDIVEKFERPPEILPYYEYRKRFIKEDLISTGQAFIREHRKLLQAIEAEYGVSKEIICGILGVETRFGKPGIEKYRAFDALNTAYFLYPRREAFYREEVIAYVLMCREEGIDPLTVNSSYAGAMGVPQFMPSSFRKYAVDFDKDGKRDLWNSKGDIFASVANYLKVFGWKPNGLLHLPAHLADDSPEFRKSMVTGIRKTMPLSAVNKGVEIRIPEPVQREEEVSFAFYQPQEGTEALLALFDNFRAITRYNFSLNYALTVTELAELFSNREVS